MSIRIPISVEQVREFCQRWSVTELAVFGSAVRGDFREDSDVDVMVTFAPEAEVGFLSLGQMERELAAMFGREVDLVTKTGLKPRVRDSVIAEAEVLYAA